MVSGESSVPLHFTSGQLTYYYLFVTTRHTHTHKHAHTHTYIYTYQTFFDYTVYSCTMQLRLKPIALCYVAVCFQYYCSTKNGKILQLADGFPNVHFTSSPLYVTASHRHQFHIITTISPLHIKVTVARVFVVNLATNEGKC